MGSGTGEAENASCGLTDIELLKQYAVELIAKQIREKERSAREPMMAIMSELTTDLMADFRLVLNELVKEKVLSWHPNVNGVMMFEFRRK